MDITRIGTSWEELTSTAIDLLKEKEIIQWQVGEIVSKVEKYHGYGYIPQFADVVRRPYKTLMGWKRVYDYYPQDAYLDFQMLPYSYFREAMRLENVQHSLFILGLADKGNVRFIHFVALINAEIKAKQSPLEKVTPNSANRSYKGRSAVLEIFGDKITLRLRTGDSGDLKALVGKDVEIIIKELD